MSDSDTDPYVTEDTLVELNLDELRTRLMPPKRAYKSENGETEIDRCQTPPSAIRALLAYVPEHWVIWESACGEGYLSEEFARQGRPYIATDVLMGQDYNFFSYSPATWDVQITNLPFSKTAKWVERSLELQKPFALIMKTEAIGTKSLLIQMTDRILTDRSFDMAEPISREWTLWLPYGRINYKMPNLGWGDETRKSNAQFATMIVSWGIPTPSPLMAYRHTEEPKRKRKALDG